MQYPTIIEAVFRHYTDGAEDMNLAQYLKFSKECGFLDRRFTKSEITTIFNQSSNQETKVLPFYRFKDNFTHFAHKKGLTKNDIARQIESYGKSIYYKDIVTCNCGKASSMNSISGGSSRAELPTMSDISNKSLNEV